MQSFVYVAQIGHIYKIGISVDPVVRMRMHKSHLPAVLRHEVPEGTKVVLLHTIAVDNAAIVETWLHDRFKHLEYRDRNSMPGRTTELFRLSPEDVEWLCALTRQDIEQEMHPIDEHEWISKSDAASMTGYNPRILTNKARSGELRAMQRGTIKTWYFWRPDLERLVSQPVPDV